jgi:hypothetical protein
LSAREPSGEWGKEILQRSGAVTFLSTVKASLR